MMAAEKNIGNGDDGSCGDSGGCSRVDSGSGDNNSSDGSRYNGSNCGGGGNSDSNSASNQQQRQPQQERWQGAQTTIY